MSIQHLDFGSLRAAYKDGTQTPHELVDQIFQRIDERENDGVWITVVDRKTALNRTKDLESIPVERRDDYPLYGFPFSVKDNIDVAGVPTTAACPDFAYTPDQSSTVVDRLEAAGAIFIGKTNLDQFATGLVGTRTPHGSARNPFNESFISGGSSSGSAVSVSAELVSFSLGTDTGGSGRVPASYTNTVGLKPTRGLLSNTGSVWACRSIDCICIFALTCEDAADVLAVAQGYDPADPFSRPPPPQETTPDAPASFSFAVPQAKDFDFAGCQGSADSFEDAVATLISSGGERVEIDYGILDEVSDMMFKGPLLTERYLSVGEFIESNPESCLPITRQTIESSKQYSAIDTIRMNYRIAEIKRELEGMWRQFDILVVPTIPRPFTLAELEAEPIEANLSHGKYTYFVNTLDLAAVEVPNGILPNGVPCGITFIGPAFSDLRLVAMGSRFHVQRGLPLGARDALA